MPAPKGSWEDAPENSGVTGIHAVLLKDGNVLLFHCRTYPFWSRIYQTDTNSVQIRHQTRSGRAYSCSIRA